MTTNLKINKSLKATVGTQAEAETNIKSALQVLNSDIKKTEKTQTVLTLSVLDYALISSASSVDNGNVSKENISVYRTVIKENAEASFPNDDATVKKIQNQASVPIMSAMLCMAENTGFSVGYVLRDSQAYRTEKDAVNGKNRTLKEGYRKEVFYTPKAIFPMRHVAGSKVKDEVLEENSSVNIVATQEIIRVAYKIFFEGKALNSLKTDIAKTERDVEGKQQTSVPQNGKDLLAILNLAVQSVEDGLLETIQPEEDAKTKFYDAYKVKVLKALDIIEKGFSEAEAKSRTEVDVEEIKKISLA